MARHLHLHIRTTDVGGLVGGFIESQHPRGRGGKFTKGGGATRAAKAVGRGALAVGKELAGTGKHDYHTLQQHFQPGSEARTGLANKVRKIATSVPQLLKTHVKEQKETVVNAGAALKHIFTGNKPSAKEFTALVKFGSMVGMSVMGAMHGDPTGSVGHALMAVIEEAAHHTALEHIGELGIGLGRMAHGSLMGRKPAMAGHDAAPDEQKLLQQYIMKLADNIEKMKLKAAQQQKPNGKSNGKGDGFRTLGSR